MALIATTNWLRASPDERPEKVAARALSTRLAKVWKCLQRAAKPGRSNPKHVHALRVATRRANAAVEMFGEFLPPKRSAWIKNQLRRLRRSAGEVRELDVLSERLANGVRGEGKKKLVARLRRQREEAQKPISEIHRRLGRADRFEQRRKELVKRTLQASKKSSHRETPRFGEWARLKFETLAVRFLQADATDEWNPKIWHAFRIEAKAIRYSLEILAGTFSSALQTELYPLVVELQERLGGINDLALTGEHLRRSFSKSQRNRNRALRDWANAQKTALTHARQEFLTWYHAGAQDALRHALQCGSPDSLGTS